MQLRYKGKTSFWGVTNRENAKTNGGFQRNAPSFQEKKKHEEDESNSVTEKLDQKHTRKSEQSL